MTLALVLLCLGAAEAAEPPVAVSTQPAPVPSSRLEAAPNPCVVKPPRPSCRSLLSWKAETSSAAAQVALVTNGGPDRPIGCGATGSRELGWIVPGNVYVFTLYESSGCDAASRGARLASVTVTGRAEAKAAAEAAALVAGLSKASTE